MADSDPIRAALTEAMAQAAHDEYEHRASEFGWETNERTRVSWNDLPASNKALMLAANGAALAVVESWAPTKPCPDCFVVNGVRYIELGGQPVPADGCPTCDGTSQVVSDVPGIIELFMEVSHPAVDLPADAVAAGAPAHIPASYRLREGPRAALARLTPEEP